MVVAASNLKASPRSWLAFERRMSIVMALVVLPWIAAMSITAGGWGAVTFFGFAVMVYAAGYSIVSVALPAPIRGTAFFLAPAVGILAISATTAFWVRLGLPLIWVTGLWFGMAAIGGLFAWRDRRALAEKGVAYGWALVLLSALVCVVYFLPAARNDAVLRRDGSFNWIYVDTQAHYAIASGIKAGVSPPRVPGCSSQELFYHFGPYAPAAVVSRLTRLDLGDALARVTRGAALWALFLSCFGLGTLLSRKATGEGFGGIMSVAGLFFYGSLMSLFADERNSSSHVTGAILFKIRGVEVLADGGPFSHLILGHSMLYGLVAITAIMGLCLVERERKASLQWRGLILLVLPALAVPVHSAAALYCFGVAGILLCWGRLKSIRSWLQIVLMLCLFIVAWKIMGFDHAPDSASGIKEHMGSQWWSLAVGFVAGLGFRIVGFRWITRPLSNPLSALVVATVLGLLSFSVLLQLGDGNEHYGIYFLQCVFSLFAFSRLTPGFWRGVERSQWMTEWLRLARNGTILFAACGILVGLIAFVIHSHTGITFFPLKILLSFLLVSLLTGTLALMKRSSNFAKVSSAILMGVLMIGFLAWITPWFNFGLGRMKMDVTLTPGEVRGLNRLRELAAPDERFATNRHVVDTMASGRERSYAYTALSERQVLLEGYLYRGVTSLPWFNSMLNDNDLMFTTSNPDTLRDIAKGWRVRWLVTRPGTDIALPRPLPAWLVEQQDTGDLKIYRIN